MRVATPRSNNKRWNYFLNMQWSTWELLSHYYWQHGIISLVLQFE
jgi:hypothetical protein